MSVKSGMNCLWMIRFKNQWSKKFSYLLETASYCQHDAWVKWGKSNMPRYKKMECVLIDLDAGLQFVGKGYNSDGWR